jgi:AcrR family transcriptional regulator
MNASREGTAARRPGRRATNSEPYTLESLVEVAATAFLERGYDATSMEDLSRAAGITKSSFYHHVSGKEALLRGALDRALDGLFGVLAEPAALRGPAVERLRHIVRRQVEVLATELPYVTLLLRLRGNTETERWALARRREFDQAVAALVREATETGATHPEVDPVVAARLLSGTVNSLIEWYRPGRVTVADLVDAVERQVFDGLLGASGTR